MYNLRAKYPRVLERKGISSKELKPMWLATQGLYDLGDSQVKGLTSVGACNRRDLKSSCCKTEGEIVKGV